jgi:2-C-methyl-D-erythritol 4-phosphate cytidylyltransferase
MKKHLIIPAAGQSRRFGEGNKVLSKLGGKSVLRVSLEKFIQNFDFANVLIVNSADDECFIASETADLANGRIRLIRGGKTRAQSVIAAWREIENSTDANDLLVIHNAANPMVSVAEISQVIDKAQEFGAAFVAHPASCTLHRVENGASFETLNRQEIYQAQTPQALKVNLFKKALIEAEKQNFDFTDEITLLHLINHRAHMINANERNFKITYAHDLELMRRFFDL